jgi:hypothetical protein
MKPVILFPILLAASLFAGCATNRGGSNDQYTEGTNTVEGNPQPSASPSFRPGMNPEDPRDPQFLNRPQPDQPTKP